jgi:tight adherence protein B
VVGVTTVCTAAIGTGIAFWLLRASRRYRVLDRVRTRPARRLPPWFLGRLEPALDRAAIEVPAEHVVELWVAAAIGVAVLAVPIDVRLAAAAAGAVVAGGPVALYLLRERRARAVAAAVPVLLEHVASELRAGGTVATALAWIGRDPGPLRTDFARLGTRLDLGASLPDALDAWARERPGAAVRSSSGALAVAHDVGGRAADALDSLATSVREQAGIVAEAHALSAQARYSAIVMTLGPIAYLAFTAIVDRRTVSALLGTTAGRCCALAGVALELAGATWMRRVLAEESLR